ncbi:type I polyketide synthase, partial [Plesiocystis pacifica]|uniref:type I polyketide synthase n=1 Tax=Plesiocystis pacifica TaxID=191768 RepID=UPI0018DCC096
MDWGAFFGSWGLPSAGPVPERLPTYAFQRAPYWLSPTPALAPEQGKGAAPLGLEATATPSEQSLWAAVDAGDLAGLGDLLELGDDDDARDALRRALPGLERWRRRARARAAVDAWSYAVDWRPVEARAATTAATTPVLFASTRDREHPRVAALAEAFGARVECLDLDALADAEGRAQLGERLAALNPDAPLLSLLALDETLDPARPGLPAGAALNVALIQGLARAPGETRLWLLTFGAVGDQPGQASAPLQRPLQAMTAGLGQAASLERPELVAGVIDLPAQADALADEAAALSLWLDGDETHLALRPEGAHARRLIPTAELSNDAAPLAELSELSGTALITGGTGGLGSALARELVRAGVDKLVLTSRRGPTAPGAEALRASLLALAEERRARPLEVEIVACDITDAEATRAVLATIDAGDSPLRAVIHAAGIAGAFEPLDSLELDALAPVTGAKVEGARILDALLDERGPDRQPELFVLISSIAATWGSGQQLAYSAANAYLDALSQARRARGQAAFAVAWGPMGGSGGGSRGGGADEGVGMATGDALVHLERRGLRPVPMATVAQLTLLTAHQTRAESGAGWLGERSGLTLVDVDWRRFYPSYTLARPRPLLAAVEPEAEPSEGQDATASEPAFVAELRGLVAEAEGTLDAEAPRRAVLGLVLQTTRQILGFAPDHALDARRGFADLGLDSLMAVDMRTALNKATGLSLPATLTFDHPTPERVTALLLDSFREVLEPAPQAQLSRAPEAAPPVEVRSFVDAGQPIAVVGVGLRLPGGVTSLDELWALLDEGRDVLVPIPKSRWDNDAIYDPDSEAPGKTYVRHGAFLDQPIEDFDPAFFNISPREAAAIDPQHRLLMEAAWEALERAGVVPGELLDSLSGTFIGVGQSDYAQQLHRNPAADAYAVMGTHASFASGRLSFTLGLQGPAVAVDTACSSSLVALHMAAKALRNGECDLALTGGAQVLLSPDSYISLSRMRAVAPDGRCKTFSANADGYGRGEGVVVLALERLDDALAKGREILALVRGTAVNHDGASSGITAPNGTSQQKVLRAALADAELEPRDIDYVECHGTGTRLGDPIEVQALGAVFGRDREPERPLLIGAIKSTLGHLETAAGVAGIAKVLAALRHRRLPANAHSQPPNPHIEWDALPVEVVAEGRAWTDRSGAGEQPLRAGVSSFGLSGTNAHIILEQAPAPATFEPPAATAPLILPLSARSPEALRAHAGRLAAHLRGLEAGATFEPAELAWTLATKRSHFEHRAAVVVPAQASPAAIAERLDPVAADAPAATHVRAEARAEGKVCFVFPGQGSQWPAMARELLEQSPEFRASVEACAQALAPHVDWDLLAVLEQREGAAELTRVDVVQPVLFAVMVSLAAVWRSCGVTPDLVIGHSQGEIAAAHVAGILSLEDAAKVVALRSRVITQLAGTGAMAATALDADSLREVLEAEAYRGRVALGVDNGPASTVASGDPEAIDALVEDLNARGVFARRVKVDYASHCHHVAGIEADLLDALAGLEPREAAIEMLSTVEPDVALDGRRLDGRYWYENLRQTVRFAEAVDRACAHGHRFFVEISPHPVMPVALDGLVRAIGVEAAVLPSLRRDEGSLERLLASVGALHCHGHRLDWAAALGRDPEAPASPAVALPTYPFQRARHWIEAQSETADLSSAGLQSLEHPILRAYFTVAGEPVKRVASTSLAEDSLGWLADHRVHGRTVFPGAGLVDLGLSAALELWPQASGLRLDELLFAAPLILDAAPLELQVVLEGDDPRRRLLSVHTRRARSRTQGAGLPADELDAGWVEHARGSVSLPASLEGAEAPSWPVDESGREPVDLEACYARALALGLDYGPAFRGLERAWIAQPDDAGTVELHAELRLPADAGASEGHAFHPALLDALTHLLLTQLDDDSEVALLPFAYRGATLHRPAGEQLRVRAELHRPTADATPRLRFWAWTPAGELVASLDALELRPASPEQLRDRRPLQHAHALRWEPATVESADAGLPGRRFGLLGDAEALAEALTTLGAEVVSAPSLGVLLERNEAAEFDQLLRIWPTPGPEVLDAALPARVDAA